MSKWGRRTKVIKIEESLGEVGSTYTRTNDDGTKDIIRTTCSKQTVNGMDMPTEPVPDNPRWLLYPNQDELRRATVLPEAMQVDVTYPNPVLQELLASWLWNECENVVALRRLAPQMKELFGFFGISKESGKPLVTNVGITKWLAELNGRMKPESVRHYKSWARSIIGYGVEQGLIEQEQTVPMLLSVSERSRRWTPDESTAANIDDLKTFAQELERRSANSLLDELVYCAFVVITFVVILTA